MLFNTPTEWVALGITLFAGWLFGLASSSGGKKWKRLLQEEEESSAAWREEAERAQRRVRELEAQQDAVPARPVAPTGTRSEPVDVRPSDSGGGTSFLPLAAAAGAGATAATWLNRDTKEEPAPESDTAKNWIPEGPPPPPLAMGTPEPAPQPQPQPIAPDAPAYPTTPAPVQEEVKAAEPDPSFQGSAPPPPAPTIAASAPETAPTAPVAAEPTASTPVREGEQVQKGHEWLPPHVRAEPQS